MIRAGVVFAAGRRGRLLHPGFLSPLPGSKLPFPANWASPASCHVRHAVAASKAGSAGAAAPAAAAAGGGGGGAAAGRGALDNTSKIIRTLFAYVWPEKEPALRARVVVSLALLVGAKVAGMCVPFLFKEICDSLDATQLIMVGDGSQAGGGVVSHAKLALVAPLSALVGCECPALAP